VTAAVQVAKLVIDFVLAATRAISPTLRGHPSFGGARSGRPICGRRLMRRCSARYHALSPADRCGLSTRSRPANCESDALPLSLSPPLPVKPI